MPGSHVSPVYLLLRTKKACGVRTENVLLPILYTNNINSIVGVEKERRTLISPR